MLEGEQERDLLQRIVHPERGRQPQAQSEHQLLR